MADRPDPYVMDNRAALAEIDGSPEFHGVDGRTVAAFERRGLVYRRGWDDDALALTDAGSAALRQAYAEAESR